MAIKKLFDIREERITREIEVLETIKGCRHTIELLDIARDKENNSYLVLNYVETYGVTYKRASKNFTPYELQLYFRHLLEALADVNSRGVMHRDVKNGNVLLDPVNRELILVDYGLSEFYTPNEFYNIHVASWFHKPPELLMMQVVGAEAIDERQYDYRMDMWSVGCLFGAAMFRRSRMFKGDNNDDQIVKIADFFGQDVVFDYLEKYDLVMLKEQEEAILKLPKEQASWLEYVYEGNEHMVNDLSLDLLSKMLAFDFNDRITAAEALEHPYFKLTFPEEHSFSHKDV